MAIIKNLPNVVKQPKVLIWDLEIVAQPSKELHRLLYTVQYLEIKHLMMSANVAHIICFGYKWLGEKETHCIDVVNTPSKDKRFPDKEIVKKALKLISEADYLVAHYGDQFDRKFLETRLAMMGLPAIPQINQIDTCKIGRSKFKLSSNRLNELAIALDVPLRKLSKNWPEDWLKIAFGDLSPIPRISHYCRGDVAVLEQIYKKLAIHKVLAPGAGVRKFCNNPVCGSSNLKLNGFRYTIKGRKQRYQCQDCGHWMV